jgi:hypothetical protein
MPKPFTNANIDESDMVISKTISEGYKVGGLDAQQLLNSSITASSITGGNKTIKSLFTDLAAPIPYLYHPSSYIPCSIINNKYINTDTHISTDIYDKLLELITTDSKSKSSKNKTKSKRSISHKSTKKNK